MIARAQQANTPLRTMFDSPPTAQKGVQNIRARIPRKSPDNFPLLITCLKFYIASEKTLLHQLIAKFLEPPVQVMPGIAEGLAGFLGDHTQLLSFKEMEIHRPSLFLTQTAQGGLQTPPKIQRMY